MATDPIRLAGDPTARAAGEQVAELFQEHGRMVYGLCRVLLRDPVEADDATQAAFVSAFKALLGGGTVREPAAWLATIARNECRARAHARMREPLPLRDDDVGHAREPHDEVNRRIAVEEIREAIAELPEKQREAVVLRDLYGMRYDEVGAALGLSRASVEALLFRGRRRLRVSLKPLASGALVVPIAVREGIAQALPGFAASATGTGAVAGGVTASAVGGGLFAKLAAAPVAAKMAAAAVAVGAAGSVGVVEAERGTGRDPVKAVAQQASADVSTSVPDAPLRVRPGGGNLRDDDERSAASAREDGDAGGSGGHDGDRGQRAGSGAREADDDLERADASKERRDANDDEEHAARAGRASEETGSDDAEPKGEGAKGATQGTDRTEESEKPESERAGSHEGQDDGSATLEQPKSRESDDEPEAAEPAEPDSSGASESGDHSEGEPEETEPPA